MMANNKKRAASANIDEASNPPNKRQRTSTPSSLPSSHVPALRAEPNKPEDVPQVKRKITLVRLVAPHQSSTISKAKQEPGPENQPPKTSIVLHHKVHPPWQRLPFDKLQDIQLKIAINAQEKDSDIVFYAPQSATQTHIAPWKRRGDKHLEVPQKAVIVTKAKPDGFKTHEMLFGQDMEEALKHKERYQHLAVIEQKMSRYWFPEVKKILGEGSDKVLSIKNPFDKSQGQFKVAEPIELEVCRMRYLLETIKEHFRRNSGLSIPEVQDIFLKRTEINIVSFGATDGELAFEHEVHTKWIEQMGVPIQNVRRISRAEACAFFCGCNLLHAAQLKAASECRNPSDLNSATSSPVTTVVLDVEGFFAGASTVTSIATNDHCAVKAVTKANSTRHGLVKLRELIKAMLERNYSGTICAAAWESNKTSEELLEHLVADFEIALDVYGGEETMTLCFPKGLTTIQELVLFRKSVEAVVQEWLEPIIALAKEQLCALNGTPAGHQDQHVKRHILMTGFWSQPKCIVHLFNTAIRSDIIEGDSFLLVKTIDNSHLATLGALWSMTANGKGHWEQEVTG